MPEAISQPTEPTMTTAPMTNLVPAFMPSIYPPRPLQRPTHRFDRTLDPRDVHFAFEGIVEPHDRRSDPQRQRDLRQRAHAAADGNHRLRPPHDQRVAHLAHAGRDRHVDVLIRRRRIGARQDADGHASDGRTGAHGHGFHHATQTSAQDHGPRLREQSTHHRGGHRLIRRAGAAAHDRDEGSHRPAAAQWSAAPTARLHSGWRARTAAASGPGVKRRNCRPARNSSGRRHTPAASPASPAAPSAVVSTTSGRATGTPSRSAWNCISQSFAAAPPSTWSAASRRSASPVIASSTSLVPNAIASSAARTRCARVVPRVSPTIVPRAFGSQCGAPSPTNAGTKYTPPVSGTSRASCSDSDAWVISLNPSRRHWIAAPAMKTQPSSAYTSSPRGPHAIVVSSPCRDSARRAPVFRSKNAPVP